MEDSAARSRRRSLCLKAAAVGYARCVPEPGRLRGRIAPKQNAILIALAVVGVPVVTIAVLSLDKALARVAVFTGWIVLFGVVAGIFRLRFERMNRR